MENDERERNERVCFIAFQTCYFSAVCSVQASLNTPQRESLKNSRCNAKILTSDKKRLEENLY